MNEIKKHKATVIKSVKKMMTNKGLVRSYMKGATTIQSLNNKGIKFAKPL